MRSLLINIGLWWLGYFALVFLAPLGLLYELIFKKFSGKSRRVLLGAISLDQSINATCGSALTDAYVEEGGYNFGNPDETMSGVYGKNQRLNKLVRTGDNIRKTLDFLDENHSEKSIEEDENIKI